MRPLFHLSFPVRDLTEALDFYTQELGAGIGRRSDECADVLVFGAQLTLHRDPSNVPDPMPRTRHFGATISWNDWESVAARLAGRPFMVEPPTVSFEGEPIEQAKLMIADPSGNLVEIKTYRRPDNVLGPVVGGEHH